MNAILNNPYRVIGLLAGEPIKEEHRHIKRLNMLLSANQVSDDVYCFAVLGPLKRTQDNIQQAMSALNLDKDRMSAALFWFYNGSRITDEPAFDAMIAGNSLEAINIWKKVLGTSEITERNCSAIHNLSTLLLCNASFDKKNLEQAIDLKLQFLESSHCIELKKITTDQTYKISKKELQLLFLNQLQHHFETTGNTINNLVNILYNKTFIAKIEFFKILIEKSIVLLNQEILSSQNNRQSDPNLALKTGSQLFSTAQPHLELIKTLTSNVDIRYQSNADKLADEILECGMIYFDKHNSDSNYDYSSTLDLYKKAALLAVGQRSKMRCNNNIEHIEEWIQLAPERKKEKLISSELLGLDKIIDLYVKKPQLISNAVELVNLTKTYLNLIANKLGQTDKLYLSLSTRVAQIALNNIIYEVNQLEKQFDYNAVNRTAMAHKIKNTLNEAWAGTLLIDSLDVKSDFSAKRSQNKKILSGLCVQFGINTNATTSSRIENLASEKSFSEEDNSWKIWILFGLPTSFGLISWGNESAIVAGFVFAILIIVINWLNNNYK